MQLVDVQWRRGGAGREVELAHTPRLLFSVFFCPWISANIKFFIKSRHQLDALSYGHFSFTPRATDFNF